MGDAWACGFEGTHRTHQKEALAAFDEVIARGGDRAYLVLPPGAGKTLVGLEAARRLGRKTLVLGPNTAIQAQWLRTWERFTPTIVETSTDRALPTDLTVLTYQALAVFDPDKEVDEEGHAKRHSLDRLHDNGRALVERMRADGPWTLVLDECHHLLEIWGKLLAEVIEYVEAGDPDRVAVVGLTATPRTTLTPNQNALVARLFGDITYAVSTPAVVKSGHIAPFQELAYLTEPTPHEAGYIAAEAERFDELKTDLLDPEFGTTSFLGWCDRRFVDRPWNEVEKLEPVLAAAALRLHHAGLLDLPAGARMREEHRHRPTAEDWVALIQDYARHCLLASDDERDERAYEAIRAALPAVGYTMTRRGVRAGRSPVDRVLARSAAKTDAVLEILDTEQGVLDDELRALVVCDHERATALLSGRLAGVLSEQAGSARLLLERLLEDERGRRLDPILMTARTVACGRETAESLLAWLSETEPELELTLEQNGNVAEIQGRWTSRRWVPLVTGFFQAGGTRTLIGTRALLGEGWDAHKVNVVVDLTTATNPTAVVQIRGRGIRLDPAWPSKVANTWTVVAVTPDHPKGAGDYERFVAKHAGFLAVDGTGDVTAGVPHVDPELSPYAPPDTTRFDALNARFLDRAGAREDARELWAVGEPYEDATVHAVRVRTGRTLGLVGTGAAGLAPPELGTGRKKPARGGLLIGGAAGLAGAASIVPFLPDILGAPTVILGTMAMGVVGSAVDTARGLRGDDRSALHSIGIAVVEGLAACDLAPKGARDGLRLTVTPDGYYRLLLTGVPEDVSVRFAEALDEVLSPLTAPRYVIARFVIAPPEGRFEAFRLALRRRLRRPIPGTVVWHAVPALLGKNKRRANAFARAWAEWVGPTKVLSTSSAEGTGVLHAQRGDDPFAVTTQMRVLWR